MLVLNLSHVENLASCPAYSSMVVFCVSEKECIFFFFFFYCFTIDEIDERYLLLIGNNESACYYGLIYVFKKHDMNIRVRTMIWKKQKKVEGKGYYAK